MLISAQFYQTCTCGDGGNSHSFDVPLNSLETGESAGPGSCELALKHEFLVGFGIAFYAAQPEVALDAPERGIAMSSEGPTLHLLCGKIAAGKSTLAAKLSDQGGTVLISEDSWLSALFKDEMSSIKDYVRCSTRIRAVMEPHVLSLLGAGISVVLDFPANTFQMRTWMRRIVEQTSARHVFHILDVPDEVCLGRLRARNAAGDHAFEVSEAQFHQVTKHFAPPTPAEGFNIVRHQAE